MIESIPDGVILTIHAQPKAAKTQFAGVYGNALKFRVAAHPVEGEANTVLCDFLAQSFSISKRSVEICSGWGTRHKRIKLLGVTAQAVRVKFQVDAGDN